MRALALVAALLLVACNAAAASPRTLAEARAGHQTVVDKRARGGDPIPAPPGKVLRQVTYPAAPGDLGAYVTPPPGDGKRHPAIIWMTGGDSNSIGDLWSPSPPQDDQTARAFREAGIVTMYPSLRGGNENPGLREGAYGEVEDILAAADYLAKLDYVDPTRIYLGGHSTGGTLVLLTAEMSSRFRAVFAFGPVGRFDNNYARFLGVGFADQRELDLRSPGLWLDSLKTPTFVLEGAGQGNRGQVEAMAASASNPLAHFFIVAGADHFSVLSPATKMLAGKILADTGPTPTITVTKSDIDGLMTR